MDSNVHYLPLTPGFFSILVFAAAALVVLIQLRILRYAYMRLGIGPGVALLLLFGSLIGSYFNIPITVLSGPPVRSGQIVDFFGMRYVVPYLASPSTRRQCRRRGDSDDHVRLFDAALSALAESRDRDILHRGHRACQRDAGAGNGDRRPRVRAGRGHRHPRAAAVA